MMVGPITGSDKYITITPAIEMLKPGRMYKLRFDVRTSLDGSTPRWSSSDTALIKWFLNTSAGTNQKWVTILKSDASTGGWLTHELVFWAPRQSTSWSIQLLGGVVVGGTAYYDFAFKNFEIIEV